MVDVGVGGDTRGRNRRSIWSPTRTSAHLPEVQLAVDAREALKADGIHARVVSVPCLEWFEEQDEAYRESVLPQSITARVSVEAGLALTWTGIVGDKGRSVSIEHFGASADYKTLFNKFGITTDAVVAAAKETLGK